MGESASTRDVWLLDGELTTRQKFNVCHGRNQDAGVDAG